MVRVLSTERRNGTRVSIFVVGSFHLQYAYYSDKVMDELYLRRWEPKQLSALELFQWFLFVRVFSNSVYPRDAGAGLHLQVHHLGLPIALVMYMFAFPRTHALS